MIKKYFTLSSGTYKDQLIHDREPDALNSTNRKTYLKLFLLGLIEFTPIALGILATAYLDKLLFSYDFVVFGIVISMVLIKQLSKNAPTLPFSLQH